jgi:hypothetical protein
MFGIGALLFGIRMQEVHAKFQQFGQHLQSGNLSAAQAHFATLQQLRARSGSSSSTESSGSITQDSLNSRPIPKPVTSPPHSRSLRASIKDPQTQPPYTIAMITALIVMEVTLSANY